MAEEIFAPGGGEDPGAVFPGRFVANMLRVTAFQVGNPVSVFVLVESNDSAFHQFAVGFSMWSMTMVSIGALEDSSFRPMALREPMRKLVESGDSPVVS